MMGAFDPEVGASFVRNPGFNGRFIGDICEFHLVVVGLGSTVSACSAGECDCTVLWHRDNIEACERCPGDVHSGPHGALGSIFVNPRADMFRNRAARQAIAHAVDRKASACTAL